MVSKISSRHLAYMGLLLNDDVTHFHRTGLSFFNLKVKENLAARVKSSLKWEMSNTDPFPNSEFHGLSVIIMNRLLRFPLIYINGTGPIKTGHACTDKQFNA